ncbi:MAG: AAA-like domain-containing protein [Ardenticatenaceae bacterium]
MFHVGGELAPDSSFYVEREADRQALRALLDMAYIYLQAPRQQGTTSLIKRLIKHPLLTNLVFAYLDMTSLDWTNEAQWYWSFYNQLTRSQQIQQWITPEWIHYSLDLSGCHQCLTNIAQKANADEKNVVIALDKFGVVWKEWGSSFLSLLRSLYNARPIKPELKRLTFIIAGPFIPENLTEQIETSPFNVSVNLQLNDFSEDQVRLLLKALNYWDERNALLSKRIWYWTSGQPYLTQLICHHLSQQKHIPNTEDIDRLARNLPTEDQEHIVPFLDRLTSDQKLVEYIKRIQAGQQIRYTPRYNRRQRQLELLGVLKADASGYCMIRNRIYEQALLAADTPEPALIIAGAQESAPTPKASPASLADEDEDKSAPTIAIIHYRPAQRTGCDESDAR